MVIPGIDGPQQRVSKEAGPLNTLVAISLPQTVHSCIDPLPFVPGLVLRVEGELRPGCRLHQPAPPDAQTAQGACPAVVLAEQPTGSVGNLVTGAGWYLQFPLSAEHIELHVAVTGHISGCCGAVAHRLDAGDMIAFPHGRPVQTQCKGLEHGSHLSQLSGQRICGGLGQPPNGADAKTPQFITGGRADIEQILYRQGADNLLIVILFNTGNGIRLFVVAAQLGGDFIIGYPNAAGDAKFKLDPIADLLGDGHRRTEYPHTAGDIQPVLVQAEGFNLVGIVLIDFPGHLAEACVRRSKSAA